MSKALINHYYNQAHAVKRAGAKNEGAISSPFYVLLAQYAQAKKYVFVTEITIKSAKTKKNIRPDGILMNELRVHRGYWESKDGDDALDFEIDKKLNKDGYSDSNILFEDGQTAVLIQHGAQVMRIDMQDADKLHQLLTAFMDFRPAEILEFEKALEAFKQDIPEIARTFRHLFDKESKTNHKYIAARNRFLEICKLEINPDITEGDVREMLIQHILTEDLFTAIFDDSSFLKHNVIAKELELLISVVITREIRQNQLGEIRYYYQTLKANANKIADHNEKQTFLKVVYENFYKAYNPAGADRLGVVYTPNELVRFMVASTDALLEKHFGKSLSDKGVQILDPATGTGTFITDIIDFIAPQYLEYKYKNELHANEVSILPYYIANLNIEYSYQNKMGSYAAFENICFVDTLDNIDGLKYEGQQTNFFGFSSENADRIKRQNEQKISVIIGNPPYNANQQNENDNNKNRTYPIIDKRISDTYIKYSSAQKTKVYDMYARFFRWATDRAAKNGIVAFVTNRSFIDSRTFDGFRKSIAQEYDYIYIVDTKSDVRANPKIAGTTHNVFGIQAGIAIMFLVRKVQPEENAKKQAIIKYFTLADEMLKAEKLSFLRNTHINIIAFEHIKADKQNNWLNIAENSDWGSFISMCSKNAKLSRGNETIFEWYSLGVNTARDAWVYDISLKNLKAKFKFFANTYNSLLATGTMQGDTTIKWSEALKNSFKRKKKIAYAPKLIIVSNYRPYTKRYYIASKILSDRLTQNHYDIFGENLNANTGNKTICFSASSSTKDFHTLATDCIADLHFTGDSQCAPLYRYTATGERVDNITDWGLAQFRAHYKNENISKTDIFDYAYAVLHCPKYREKYALNLKREFPRLPFYTDFAQWAAWGAELMALHIDYEAADGYALTRIEAAKAKDRPAVKLKADKDAGTITIDENTSLTGIPAAAWDYKLGNRTALEWVLDQYKESKIGDPTVAELFNNYRFADYKEAVIDLLARLTTVAVRSTEISAAMGEK
jgi:predicted helicase